MSIVGLAASVSVIIFYIVPRVLDGKDPLTVCLIGAFIIAVISIFMSHGLNVRTSVALGSTLIVLGVTAGLAVLFVHISQVSGFGSEEAFYIQIGIMNINLKGLLLGGIIIGALGVLDDVTIAQSATVEEIHKANPSLPFKELYKRGLSVGREHIASMVNTLALAYFGAGLPLFLLFSADKTKPLWLVVNSELVVEEIIRTLVGSSALILAVPLATVLAAYVFSRRSAESKAISSKV